MNPRTTNSTGNTLHFFITETHGSGVASSALGTMCPVFRIHQAEVSLSTWPLKGMAAMRRSKAERRSVVTSTARGGGVVEEEGEEEVFSPSLSSSSSK